MRYVLGCVTFVFRERWSLDNFQTGSGTNGVIEEPLQLPMCYYHYCCQVLTCNIIVTVIIISIAIHY